MKKLLVSALMLGMIVMSGCAGDDPEGPEGNLPTVQDLAIGAASAGNSIVLVWSPVEDVDGYRVYFRETAAGTWGEAGDVTTTTFTHTATVAGYYSVLAYKGSDTSENYATPVNTLPNIITDTYTIYDNYAPAAYDSGFKFGTTGGQPGQASDPLFEQDIYAYDLSKGDSEVWLFSGDYGQFGNGNRTYMADPAGVYGYCNQYPAGSWQTQSYQLYTSDSAVFCALPWPSGDIYYVKMFDLAIAPEPLSDNGTMVSFQYEYQTLADVTVFTSNY